MSRAGRGFGGGGALLGGGGAGAAGGGGGGVVGGDGSKGGLITVKWLTDHFAMRLKFVERELFRNMNMLQTMLDTYVTKAYRDKQ